MDVRRINQKAADRMNDIASVAAKDALASELNDDDTSSLEAEFAEDVSAETDEIERRKKRIEQARERAKKGSRRGASETIRFLDGGTAKERMQELAKKMAKSGMKMGEALPQDIKQQLEKEQHATISTHIDRLLDDKISLSKDAKQHTQQLNQQFAETTKTMSGKTPQESSHDPTLLQSTAERQSGQAAASTKTSEQSKKSTEKSPREALTKYLVKMAESQVLQSQKATESTRHAREELLAKGLSPRKLTTLENNVTTMMRRDLQKKLKNSFIQFALNFKEKEMSGDLMANYETFKEMTKLANLNGVLGPGRHSVADTKDEAKEELRTFIAGELDNAIMESKIKGGSVQELINTFNKFNDIATVAKFNSAAYMSTLQQKLDDWGLNGFPGAGQPGALDTDPKGSDSRGDGRQQQAHQQIVDDIDADKDDLRTLFMTRHTRTGIRHHLENTLAITRLKSRLKKSGVSDDELQKLRDEGEGLAKLRLMDMVKESLEEKATIADVKSPAYHLQQKKYKSALKGLRALGSPLPKHDIIVMRDQIYQTMFGIIKEEYLKVKVHLETMPNDTTLLRKEKEYVSILERLKKEAKITESIDVSMSKKVIFSNTTNIIEAA